MILSKSLVRICLLVGLLFCVLNSTFVWAQKNDPKNDATTKAPSNKKTNKNNKDMATNQGDRVERQSKEAPGYNQRAYYAPDTKKRSKQAKDIA
ncbi:MAG: hypothetical protein JWO58_2774, partial [Chitinophagaceae bacterium]|nr:hypothetical protein [Chitinophagaceae bacterium]